MEDGREPPWCHAGGQELKDLNVVWKTRLGSVQKDHFEINTKNAPIRIVIVPGKYRSG